MLQKNLVTTSLANGTYILAVSGGVDSMVMLDMLSKQYPSKMKHRFIVAHVDHGIRENASRDAAFVEKAAAKYGYMFEKIESKLGPDASEARARDARYGFLAKIQKKYNAQAVITAHHQDDVIETAIINILRGTNRRGLTALESHEEGILRPFLQLSKNDIIAYANQNNLEWVEDETNTDTKYTRNYVRHVILPRWSQENKASLFSIIEALRGLNTQIDAELSKLVDRKLHKDSLVMSRSWFVHLPHDVAKEVLVYMFRKTGVKEYDSVLIERLVVDIKVGKNGKRYDLCCHQIVELTKRSARFSGRKK